MEWASFKENPHWLAIVELLRDRMGIVLSDAAQIEKTPTLLSLRVLQQELTDLQFFISIPDLFIETSDKELDSGVATDN